MTQFNALQNPLAAYLVGNATEAQLHQVQQWIDESEENQTTLDKLIEAWNQQEKSAPLDLDVRLNPSLYGEEES